MSSEAVSGNQLLSLTLAEYLQQMGVVGQCDRASRQRIRPVEEIVRRSSGGDRQEIVRRSDLSRTAVRPVRSRAATHSAFRRSDCLRISACRRANRSCISATRDASACLLDSSVSFSRTAACSSNCLFWRASLPI